MVSAVREKLKEILNELPDEKVAILLDFAQKIKDKEEVDFDDEELTAIEIEMIQASEKEYEKGDGIWWRDVKRSAV